MKFALPKAVSRITKKPTGDHAVHYRAKSFTASLVIWANIVAFASTVIASPEVSGVLGAEGMKYAAMAIAVANMALRFWTVRPVAMVAPGKTKTVAVHKI